MIIAALFTIAMIWKQPKCLSIDECIKKMWYIYNGILVIKRNKTLPFAARWIDLENTMLSQVSQRKTNTV